MQHSSSEDFGELATATPSQGGETKSVLVPLVVGVLALASAVAFIGSRSTDRRAMEAVGSDHVQTIVSQLKAARRDDVVVTRHDSYFRTAIDARETGIVIVSCSNTRRVTVDFARSPFMAQIARVVGPADAEYLRLSSACAEQRSPLRSLRF